MVHSAMGALLLTKDLMSSRVCSRSASVSAKSLSIARECSSSRWATSISSTWTEKKKEKKEEKRKEKKRKRFEFRDCLQPVVSGDSLAD